MRPTGRGAWTAACLLLITAALPAKAMDPAEMPPLPQMESPIRTEEFLFDVFADNQKSGRMRLKVMTVRDLVILDQEFTAPPLRGQEVGFESQIVYRGDAPPRPDRAKALTRLGGFKLMEGSVTFAPGDGGGFVAKESVIGYADKDRKPFAKPVHAAREAAVPSGLVLTHPAFLYFAPRLLPQPGQVEGIVYLQLPPDFAFPEFSRYQPEAVLTRSAADDEGRVEFVLKRIYPGGNAVPLLTMTKDREGRIVETRQGRFTFRPASPEAEVPPSPPAKAPGAR